MREHRYFVAGQYALSGDAFKLIIKNRCKITTKK